MNESCQTAAPSAASTQPVDLSPPITERLPLPDTVEVGQVLWVYAIPIVTVHLLALAACLPWLFSWTGLIAMVLGVHLYGQAINVCYHRQLTHRSFRTAKWLEHFFVFVGLCCLQDTPGRWVATHRFHHQVSDHRPDPHSPLVNFLWAHVGWLMLHNAGTHNLAAYQTYARDVLNDPFYMRLEKNPLMVFYAYVAHAVAYFAVGLAVGWLMFGGPMAGVQFGLSLLVWGVLVRTVVVWHITWSVNSLTHLMGYRNYATDENSRNNWLVAVLTVGEGWHNNHHFDEASASNQHRWWELDVSFYEIKLLQWLGLARDVVPTKARRRRSAQQRQAQRQQEQVQSPS